ncbi:MAG TPA: flagellar hook-basal body complex protein FliE [Pseudolabrys sp.]|nr:flagellar hook-basal body complex protein FliE [Pseudolabrys sp.]
MASPISAASAYANIARLANDLTRTPGAGQGADNADGNFSAMLKNAIGSVVEAGRKSDAQTQALANGKSNMVDVVTAVAQTEVAVDAMVAVRDKVIAAYEDIMKMPI